MHQEENYVQQLASAELSEQEMEKLKQVLDRAKDFDIKNKFNEPLEGYLLKWTNVVKGWQMRYFQLDPNQCVLHYHMSQDKRIQPPRGSLHLWGAQVSPSDEDSQSFLVNGSNGVTYRLKSEDAKERQRWVSHLRAVAASATTSPHMGPSPAGTPQNSTPLRTPDLTPTSTAKSPSRRTSLPKKLSISLIPQGPKSSSTSTTPIRKSVSVASELEMEPMLPLDPVTDAYLKSKGHHDNLIHLLESSTEGYGMEKTDKNVLLVKALSEATIHSLQDCLALLYIQRNNRLGD